MRALKIALISVILAVSSNMSLMAADLTTAVAVPRLVTFSGSVSGVSAAGTVGITFALYKEEQGGAPLWLETQNVPVDANGHFNVLLGANHSDGVPAELFVAGEAQWLGITPEGGTEHARILLSSVPYALKAVDADTLGGKPVSAFVLATPEAPQHGTKSTRPSGLSPLTPVSDPSSVAGVISGVPNYLPKFSDPMNLTTSAIFDSAGKIGIGTNAPESILDVAAGSAQTVRFGNVAWALRVGQLQSGNQFLGIGVKKTAANNSYVATSGDTASVNHTVMEFGYDGSMRLKQQAHQPDGTALSLSTSFSMLPNGNIGVGLDEPAQKLEVAGNVKISGTGNGIMFPDGTIQNTAGGGSGSGSALTGVTAGTGLSGGGTSGSPVLSLNTSYTDSRYAAVSASNSFIGSQTIGGDLMVTGNVAAAGSLSGTAVQAHVGPAIGAGIAVTATADSEDATGVDVLASALTGNTTGIHAAVNSSAGFAGIFDNMGAGNIILGRVKIGDYWVKRFRVDGTGRVYANSGYATGGADFAESFAVNGDKAQYGPGDVLVIDKTGQRRLVLSREAYSPLVAGVYSTSPGVLASPYDMDDPNLDREVPLAVVGVVPCKVSAENGPIEVGDLLVSSSSPGHAMKGTDRTRMLGAIIGKALQPLESGAGIIQVLVTLQ